MAHPEIQMYERLLDLGEGLAIYRVHIDLTREQDKNARLMSQDKFDRLAANIEKDKRLESLPFACLNRTGERIEFAIISGHHRLRAARKANITTIYLLVDETELTRSEIISKQLAHNALNGYDDSQMLRELYAEIDDVAAKIASGLTDEEVAFDVEPVTVDDITIEFNYEIVNLLFLRSDFRKYEDAIELIEKEAKIYLADKADFENFKIGMRKLAERFDVRNTTAIMLKWIDVVLDYCALRDANEPKFDQKSVDGAEQWVPIAAILGTASIPAGAGAVLKQAVDKMREQNLIGEKNVWQAVEYLAAEYLAQ